MRLAHTPFRRGHDIARLPARQVDTRSCSTAGGKRVMRLFVPVLCAAVITVVPAGTVQAAPGVSAPALPAGASAPAPSVVLESHVGERSSQTGELLEPLLRALESYGFAARPREIARLLKGRVPRPGILDAGKTADDIAQQIVVGVDAYNRGRFKEAEEALRSEERR